jgi:acyl carrier protein
MGIPLILQHVFTTVLGAECASMITLESTMHDVPGWDSVTYMAIIAALEDSTHVRFSPIEALRMTSVRGILAVLSDRQVPVA